MKNNTIKKSIFLSFFIIILIKFFSILIPIYSSESNLKGPKYLKLLQMDIATYIRRNKCLILKSDFDKFNNQMIFNLTSRSIFKQESIKCVERGVNFLEEEFTKNNERVDQLTSESINLNKKINDLINDFNKSKSLDKDKLILINNYFKNMNLLKAKVRLPIPLFPNYEIKTNPISNYSSFRFLFSGFILFFWISYIVLEDIKN